MIYLAIIVVYLGLAISFIIEDSTLGLISAMGIMAVGVYLAINGISFLNNLLVQSVAAISIGFGAYILIAGSLESLEQSIS